MIPPIYRLPLGLPLAWQDETTGQLPAAVRAFYAHGARMGPAPSAEQLALIHAYLVHVIHAPCWDQNPYATADDHAALTRLRTMIREARTFEAIDTWIEGCLELGIDPL